ncbi:MAG: ribonuclease P protein component [Pseudoflavonifractor sp.]
MKHTIALKLNHEFRRLYAKGKNAVAPCMAVYCRPNRLGYTRLGFTVSVKLGHAVLRNRIRRRLREAYRNNEARFRPGYDIVVVGRVRAGRARYSDLERQLLQTADKLGMLLPAEPKA